MDFIMPIIIDDKMETTVLTINDLLVAQNKWEVVPEFKCPECNLYTMSEAFTISGASNTLILNLNIFEIESYYLFRKRELKLKDLPSSPLTINNSKYVLKSAIFHIGRTPTDGHYYAMHRVNNVWYKLNDTTISKSSWPNDSKDAYVLFYEKLIV